MFEKLTRRSDGACETPSGLFAVAMRVRSGVKDDMAWFTYKTSVMSQVNRVEWPAASPLAILPQANARSLVLLGYASGITGDQLDAYNAAVDVANAAETTAPAKEQATPAPAPTKPPEPTKAPTVPPVATVTKESASAPASAPKWTAPEAKTAVVSEKPADSTKVPEIVASETNGKDATKKAADPK